MFECGFVVVIISSLVFMAWVCVAIGIAGLVFLTCLVCFRGMAVGPFGDLGIPG